jgi:predicted MFS family arabinose efflux permease
VLYLHVGATQLGILRAAEQIPILLFSLFVGAWVDRWRSRNVMVLADFSRAVILSSIPIAFVLHAFGIPLLVVVAFLVGVLSVFFDVAYQTTLVRLVRRDQLVQGNSALESSRSAAQIGGSALGGAVVSLLSASLSVLPSVMFFALSFLSIARIRRNDPIGRDTRERARTFRRIHEGLQLVFGNTSLRAVGLASAAFQISFAALMTVYLVFLPRTLGLSGLEVGVVLAATGPGAIIGSLQAAWLPRRIGHGTAMVGGAILGDAVLLLLPLQHGSSTVTICVLVAINILFGICGQVVDVTVISVRQAITPVRMQGRVVATINFVGMGLTPLGSLLGGVLAVECGTRVGLLLTALVLGLSPVCMLLSPLARLGRALPETHDPDAPPPAA